MKRIFLVSIILFGLIANMNAQPSKRASALNYLKYEELDKALEAINQATEHAKTKNDPRTWWYRGQIFQAIHTSKEFKSLEENAASKSFDSYKKALLFNFKDPSFHTLDIANNPVDQIKFVKGLMDQSTRYVDSQIFMDIIMNRYPALANILVNKGVQQFQKEKKYKEALESFENSLFVSSMQGKIDTAVVYYAALSANKAEDYKKAKTYFKTIVKVGYGATEKEKASMYYLYAKVYEKEGDTLNYEKTIKKGIEKYPNGSGSLVVELVNLYLGSGQQDKAIEYLQVAIDKDSTNANLHSALGSLYDTHLKQPEKAIESYKKSIALDAKGFDANYNLGALYYNQGAELNDKANETDDNKKYQALKKKSDAKFKEAIPFLEVAHQANEKDIPTMQSLKYLYYKVQDMPKHDAIKAKLTGK